MAVDKEGNIIQQDGTPTGGQVDVITGEMLKEAPSVNFNRSQESPVFPVDSLEIPEIQATQPEVEAQGFSKQIQTLNEQLLGQSAVRTATEEGLGLPESLKQQNALTSQLSGLIKESQAIPLQIQQESIGRGRTAGGVAPIQTGRLRENAIKSLGVASQLEAVRGNIELAQNLADRAVAQRFDPIKEQLAVAQANLQVIKDSPAFTLADKKRALKTELALQDRERAIESSINDETARRNFALKAIEMGLPTGVAEKINLAQSIDEAMRIAAPHMSEIARTNRQADQLMKDLQVENLRNQIDTRKEELRLKAALLAQESTVKGIEEAEATKLEAQSALSVQGLITDLRTHKKLKLATGFTSILPTLPGFATRDFNKTHEQLKKGLTRENLSALKGLGAMSDRELGLIEDSTSKLSLDLPESEYTAELQKIADLLEPTFAKALNLGVIDPIDVGSAMGLSAEDMLEMGIGGQTTNGFNPSKYYAQ